MLSTLLYITKIQGRYTIIILNTRMLHLLTCFVEIAGIKEGRIQDLRKRGLSDSVSVPMEVRERVHKKNEDMDCEMTYLQRISTPQAGEVGCNTLKTAPGHWPLKFSGYNAHCFLKYKPMSMCKR